MFDLNNTVMFNETLYFRFNTLLTLIKFLALLFQYTSFANDSLFLFDVLPIKIFKKILLLKNIYEKCTVVERDYHTGMIGERLKLSYLV